MFGSEEGVKRIDRVLENVERQTGDFQRLEIILPKGNDGEDGGVGVSELKKTSGRIHMRKGSAYFVHQGLRCSYPFDNRGSPRS